MGRWSKKTLRKNARSLGYVRRVYIGFSADGGEIVATYGKKREARADAGPDELVTGPWVLEGKRCRRG